MNDIFDEVVYVVKSHKRVDKFYEKTYKKVIVKHNFPLEKIYVFVSLDEDVVKYKEKYPEMNIVKAPLGVANVDNFITDYFPENQKIIYMNDDVKDIMQYVNSTKVESIQTKELLKVVRWMFSIMEKRGISYGGFYPVNNPFYMGKERVKTGLCFIFDPFSLCINRKSVRINVADKSDFEKSIQHFIYGGELFRYNYISLKVENFVRKGGFEGRNSETEYETAKLMETMYPDYISGIKIKSDGTTSLRLKNIPSRKSKKENIS